MLVALGRAAGACAPQPMLLPRSVDSPSWCMQVLRLSATPDELIIRKLGAFRLTCSGPGDVSPQAANSLFQLSSCASEPAGTRPKSRHKLRFAGRMCVCVVSDGMREWGHCRRGTPKAVPAARTDCGAMHNQLKL